MRQLVRILALTTILASLTVVHGFCLASAIHLRCMHVQTMHKIAFGSLYAKKPPRGPGRSDASLDNSPASHYLADPEDTIRVRIWRALVNGEELSLKQLASTVGESRNLRSHLQHVEKQAETLANKSVAWKIRRGLLEEGSKDDTTIAIGGKRLHNVDKIRLRWRRGKKKHDVFVRLG